MIEIARNERTNEQVHHRLVLQDVVRCTTDATCTRVHRRSYTTSEPRNHAYIEKRATEDGGEG